VVSLVSFFTGPGVVNGGGGAAPTEVQEEDEWEAELRAELEGIQ